MFGNSASRIVNCRRKVMNNVHSKCCEFHVGHVADSNAYCYVCGKVHLHKHLDLRALRTVLLGKVVARHNLNWEEIEKDRIKYSGITRGNFCQSLLTEIEALCPHGEPVLFNGKPLRLHMCFGADDSGRGEHSDLSVENGLDFTTDICSDFDAEPTSYNDRFHQLVNVAEQKAEGFKINDILKYYPDRVAFERI